MCLCQAPVDLGGRLKQVSLQLVRFGYTIVNALAKLRLKPTRIKSNRRFLGWTQIENQRCREGQIRQS
jgi:hypothetical protein